MRHGKKVKVVCFGGGTGMPSLLRGLKTNPNLDVTAVVSMFDNGGSSGELRDKFGILPPGDILKCLLALAEDDASARKILLRRISHERFPGHTGGNVLLMGLEKVYEDYRDAVRALGQILSVQGTVVPVALTQGVLCAEHADGFVSKGEVGVDKHLFEGREIKRLFLEPHVEASPDALEAIRNADVLCAGPGSFYTSVMPNFLPRGVREGVQASHAPLIFIANLLAEGRGMQGYAVPRVVETFERYAGRKADAVVVNTKVPNANVLARYAAEYKYPLRIGIEESGGPARNANASVAGGLDPRFVSEDLWLDEGIARHDSERLAEVVSKIIEKMVK
ncbi:MAG: hypothetical protein A2945_01305 [Candidatus Liptonbacteria bacterium RIFCSPLOWO2_01_FULL_52_25]|uniref:Putative gluconeogenesis factor n=1 Tax=Candidatus Liptonbacteria bacterium RIFCSPLOWO2_01_FULL_52_25 TaxID=1798650 RepID=A0A1G2CGD8_9BACT|nr:MAG: hypothetical protein A2945_01305 [Candidatus Liptonbacteria bacterium RIFCSPLOWO2_01_FULL_52_25]